MVAPHVCVRVNGLFEIARLIRSEDNNDMGTTTRMEPAMLREQTINFLQATVVFLLLTNAVSAVVAVYSMRLVNVLKPEGSRAVSAVERKLEAMLGRLS
jgi:hypothetical protein